MIVYFQILQRITPPPSTTSTADEKQYGTAGNTVTLSGSIYTSFDSGAVPSLYAGAVSAASVSGGGDSGAESRSAAPSLPTSGLSWEVSAESVTPTGLSVSGSVSDSGDTFSIPLTVGVKWNITVSRIHNGEPILAKTYEMPEAVSASTVLPSFYLMPLQSGSGTISLGFSGGGAADDDTAVFSSVSVASVKKNGSDALSALSAWNDAVNVSVSGISMKPDDSSPGEYKTLASGVYEVTLHFKKDGRFVYATTQAINVFPNMVTNTWVSNGGTGPISNGTFEVTEQLVQAYMLTNIYVGDNSYKLVDASDNNSGTPYAPLETLGAALSRLTDNTKDYTIHISGTQSGNFTLGTTDSAPNFAAHSVTILGHRGLASNGEPQDILHGTGDGTVLTISTTVPITIKNLKITGGGANNGGGIYANTDGVKITLGNGTLITDNSAVQKGGGVYIYGANSEFVMKDGSKISNNHITGSDGTYGGVGVYFGCDYDTTAANARPTFTMDGGEISGHTCGSVSSPAGAIAGIGLKLGKAVFIMNGGKITGNSAISCMGNNTFGGNIYAERSTMEIKGGEISEGSIQITNNYASAGAIWLDNTSLTMTGGKIINNYVKPTSGQAGNGGAIVSWNGSTIEITGGEISGNYIDTEDITKCVGGAIHLGSSAGSIKVGGNAYIPEGANGGTGWGRNDIFFLSASKVVIIKSHLSEAQTIAISLQTASCTNGAEVLTLDTGATTTIPNEYQKFKMNNEGFTIGSDGKLIAPALALPSSSGDIVSGNTYAVANSSAMEKLAEFSSGGCDFSGVTLQLDADITIDTEWTPIGNGTSFNGTFDGNEKTVTFASETNAEAFFGTVGGTVKNLKVAGRTSVAGIAKTASSSAVIENCESSATIIGSTEYCAGIVALVESNAKIKGCVNTGSITCNYVLPADNYSNGAGGITGCVYSGGIIDSCVNTGNVIGPTAGGIAAEIDYTSVIRNAYNSGNITSTGVYAGGIVGAAIGNGGEIENACHIYNCFNSGNVTAAGTLYPGYAGGITGKLGWGNAAWAHNCLNIGNVSLGESAKSGSVRAALFGEKDSHSRVEFCYYKEGCAGSGFGNGGTLSDTENECVKATQSGTNNAVISVDVTFVGNNYNADTSTVLSLLNAWVTANSTNGMYLEWEAGVNHWPKLKAE